MVKIMLPLAASVLDSRHWLKVSVSASPLERDWLLSASLTVVVIEPLTEHGLVDELAAAGCVALAMLALWRDPNAATSPRWTRDCNTPVCSAIGAEPID
jgi:hypothetical protein